MRILLGLTALIIAASPSAAADLKTSPERASCTPRSAYSAEQDRQKRVEPKKLGELPRGTVYMAVAREIGGCDAPLTMADYRTKLRR